MLYVYFKLFIMFYLEQGKIDYDDLFCYEPKKIEFIDSSDNQYRQYVMEVFKEKNKVKNGFYITTLDTVSLLYYYQSNTGILFKSFADRKYLERIADEENIAKEINYYYYEFDGKAGRKIWVFETPKNSFIIDKLTSNANEIQIDSILVLKLDDGSLWNKSGNFIEIFSDETIFRYSRELKLGIAYDINFYSDKCKDYLAEVNSILNLKIANKVTLDILLKCCYNAYDYNKFSDLRKLYPQFCALFISYIHDNNLGDIFYKIEGGKTIPYLLSNNNQYNISEIVMSTIDNIIHFEYSPGLYFRFFYGG